MKFTVERVSFLDALQKVQNVVPAHSPLQILSNVRLEAAGDTLLVNTTDLDLSIRCKVNAVTEVEGATTLPVRRLTSIVRELSSPEVSFEVDENDNAVIRSGASYFKIKGLPAVDFPKAPAFDGSVCFNLTSGVLREMLKKTSYAVSNDETRRVLTGVLLAFHEAKLTAVATDGRRLAMVEYDVDFPPEYEREILLTQKSVSELIHVLDDNDQPLHIYSQNTQAVFELPNTTLMTKLIDMKYPNYRQVIPSHSEECVTVVREELQAAIRRVSIVSADKGASVKLRFFDNSVEVSLESADVGEAKEVVPAKYTGKEISASYNAEYILEPLRNIDTDEVRIELIDGSSPIMIKCVIPFLYVLMPIRFSA